MASVLFEHILEVIWIILLSAKQKHVPALTLELRSKYEKEEK